MLQNMIPQWARLFGTYHNKDKRMTVSFNTLYAVCFGAFLAVPLGILSGTGWEGSLERAAFMTVVITMIWICRKMEWIPG